MGKGTDLEEQCCNCSKVIGTTQGESLEIRLVMVSMKL